MRAVVAALDGDVQALYDEFAIDFRPRFYPIVRHLLRSGPARVSEIAADVGVTQPAATQTIAEMRKLGLVASAAGRDGRERLVSLTVHGESIAGRLSGLWEAIDTAARELNSELPVPLAEVIASVFHALHRESFKDRIRRRLEND